MKKASLHTRSLPLKVVTILFWIIIIFFSLQYIITAVFPYLSLNEEIYGRFWAIKWPVLGHVTGGMLALVLGPFQFWEGFRNRNLKLHKTLGKVYMACIILSAISAFYMASTTALAVHWTWSISLVFLGIAWLTTILIAYRSIRHKRIQAHQEWMMRSYLVTFAFVIFRILNNHPAIVELGNFIERAPTIGWISWTVPLFIYELILQFRKT